MSDPEMVLIEREARLEAVKALWPKLTHRQVECLCLRLMGFTQEKIGQMLEIAQQVVDEHLAKILEKLG